MHSTPLRLNGASLALDASGALVWAERGWLVVADLHLEKGSAFAARGALLPPYDTAATLTALEAAIVRHRPTRVLCLGDSFHDRAAAGRVTAADGRRIAALTAALDWLWLAGNHDPAPPADWGGRIVHDGLREGPLTFRHEADATAPDPAGEVSGHFHPKAAVRQRGRRVSARCFASDGRRLILPAFGAFTGGLNVLDPAISGLFAGGSAAEFQVWMLARDRLHAFPAARLEADAPRLRATG